LHRSEPFARPARERLAGYLTARDRAVKTLRSARRDTEAGLAVIFRDLLRVVVNCQRAPRRRADQFP
jgi:hypothetical protein